MGSRGTGRLWKKVTVICSYPVAEEEREEEPVSVALPDVVDQAINRQSTKDNTIEALCGVVDIDDDNEPTPEYVP